MVSRFAPPLPRRAARTAAVQSVTQAPTSGVIKRRSQATIDKETADVLDRAQRSAARLADAPPASYPVAKVQTTIAQVIPVLEYQDPNTGQWSTVEDPMLTSVLDEFQWRSLQLDLQDLAGLMAWNRMVTGEHVVVTVNSGGDAIDYRIYSVQACAFGKPTAGDVTVKETPNGSVKQGTAYVVPKEAVHRCWAPHPNYPAQAWSPILAGIEPLELCSSLSRLMRKHSDSRAVAGGGKALIYANEDAEDLDDTSGEKFDPVAKSVADFGQLAGDETDLRGLLPLMLHMNLRNVESKPFVLDLVQPFEPKLIDWWNAALQRFSQAVNLAGLTVAQGGAGASNHWNEWLVSDQNWHDAFAPFADAVYGDITRLFLHGTYAGRLGATDITQYRVHYDPSKVIVPPDKKQTAVELGREGVLRAQAQATAAGFDDEDLMTEPNWTLEEERNWFLQVKSAGRVQPQGGIPIQETIRVTEGTPTNPLALTTGQPGGQTPTPPPPQPPANGQPTGPVAPPTHMDVGQRAAAVKGSPLDRLQRVNNRLAKLRRDTGKKLQERARAAVEGAIRYATGRAASMAGNAKQGTRLAAATRDLAIDLGGHPRPIDARRAHFREHGIPAPILAALGLTEEELLDDELGVYADQAGVDLDTYMQQRQDILDGGDFDPNLGGSKDGAAAAALLLVAGATAIARSALTDGVSSAPAGGEWSGIVPYSLIADALSVAAGTAAGTLPSSPDDQPTVAGTDQLDAPFAIAGDLGMDVAVYTWVHGAPDRPYEPHEALDGEPFDGNSIDFADDGTPISDVEAPDGFTDGDALYPGDHDGCTCDWDVEFQSPEEAAATLDTGGSGSDQTSGYGTESGL